MKNFFSLQKKDRASWLIFFATFTIYAVLSMARSTYSAAIASIIDEGIFTTSDAGVINAGFYLLYGGAQLIGVKILDNISPVKLVYISMFGTLASLVGMSLSSGFYMMLFFWCLCGLMQFAIWPASLRIIAEYVLPEHKSRAMSYISFAYGAGMLINYFAAAVILKFTHWSGLFVFAYILVSLCILLWFFTVKSTKNEAKEITKINKDITDSFLSERSKNNNSEKSKISLGKLLITSGLILILPPALIRTALDTGLKSWVPTMIVQNYPSVTESAASLLTFALIFINLIGVFIVNFLYPKHIKNAVWCYALTFLIALPFTTLLIFIGKIHVIIVVLLLTTLTTMMYSGHQLINVIIPSYFSKYNKAGSISAIINALASLGALISNIAFGFLAENYGWNVTIMSWILSALTAFIFCAAATPIWKKFTKKG